MSTTRRFNCPSRLLIPLFLAGFITTGCQTTVGNYFGNRGRDLGECFRLQVGAGPGIGATVRAGGLLHVGLDFGTEPRAAGVGWVYGEGFAFGHGTRDRSEEIPDEVDEGDQGHKWHRETKFLTEYESTFLLAHYYYEGEEPPSRPWAIPNSHACFGVLRALVSRAGKKWIWSRDNKSARRARIHVFDIEANVHAGIVYAKAGFSPGEFVDFLLGWFGVDIARDDRPLSSEEVPTPDRDESDREVR